MRPYEYSPAFIRHVLEYLWHDPDTYCMIRPDYRIPEPPEEDRGPLCSNSAGTRVQRGKHQRRNRHPGSATWRPPSAQAETLTCGGGPLGEVSPPGQCPPRRFWYPEFQTAPKTPGFSEGEHGHGNDGAANVGTIARAPGRPSVNTASAQSSGRDERRRHCEGHEIQVAGVGVTE